MSMQIQNWQSIAYTLDRWLCHRSSKFIITAKIIFIDCDMASYVSFSSPLYSRRLHIQSKYHVRKQVLYIYILHGPAPI